MHIEKKHKIYAGLVGAALLAWGIDATFFESAPAGPATAAASTTPPTTPEAITAATTSGDSTGIDSAKWLSDQLALWSKRNPSALDDVRDVFSASTSWAKPQPQAAVPTKTAEKLAEDFQRQHHLMAVVLSAGAGSALIDGNLLRVGQSVDGCRLISVASGCADLTTPQGQTFRIVIGTDLAKTSR
jgi:hypothetical protein